MTGINKNNITAALLFFVLSCSKAHAEINEPMNTVKLGIADIHFHTRTSDLEGPPGTTPPGITASINNTQTLALVYERQLSGPWSIVLQGGVPPTLKVDATGTAKALGRIATAKAWFPAVILKYSFQEVYGFRPYLGAGMNYTFFTDKHMTDAYTNGFGGTSSSVKLSNSWGGVMKLGAEYALDDNWAIDVGYSHYWIETKATIATETPGFGRIERTIQAESNPDAFGLLIGYKF